MKISPNLLGKHITFLFNGYVININEEKDLISFGFEFYKDHKNFVFDNNNVIGGNSNFYFKLKSKI